MSVSLQVWCISHVSQEACFSRGVCYVQHVDRVNDLNFCQRIVTHLKQYTLERTVSERSLAHKRISGTLWDAWVLLIDWCTDLQLQQAQLGRHMWSSTTCYVIKYSNVIEQPTDAAIIHSLYLGLIRSDQIFAGLMRGFLGRCWCVQRCQARTYLKPAEDISEANLLDSIHSCHPTKGTFCMCGHCFLVLTSDDCSWKL